MLSQQAIYTPNSRTGYRSRRETAQRERVATALFNRSLKEGRRSRLWNWLRRQDNNLWYLHPESPLSEVKANHRQQVPLSAIKGSVGGRVHDFDADFHPITNHSQSRWVSVAAARQQGVQLSPVELIQIDDLYFVVDGHHRLSVAQALGQDEIEANVTVYEMTGPVA